MPVSEEEVEAAAQAVCVDRPACCRCRSNARAALEAAAKVREEAPHCLDVIAFSASTRDQRILEVHFNHEVTDRDRHALLAAINKATVGEGKNE